MSNAIRSAWKTAANAATALGQIVDKVAFTPKLAVPAAILTGALGAYDMNKGPLHIPIVGLISLSVAGTLAISTAYVIRRNRQWHRHNNSTPQP